MSTHEQRIEVFWDTMSWIKSDPDLAASVEAAMNNTTVYFEDDYPAFDDTKVNKMKVTVSGDRSFQAAMRLAAENPGTKIAVMNFANAFQAGGGVTRTETHTTRAVRRTRTARRMRRVFIRCTVLSGWNGSSPL